MKSIEALGAVSEVTGSAFAVETNKHTKFLVDCGMFQGKSGKDKRNRSLNGYDSSKLDFAVFTHSHLDHIGKGPLLQGEYPIYMTPGTLSLAYISLKNAAGLSPDLYSQEDVKKFLKRTIPIAYDKTFNVDGLTITFRDAGHILGSASLEVQEQGGEKVVFSGDLGNTPSRIVQPTTPIKDADIVVMETTYGDRNRPQENPTEIIIDAVERVKKSKGTLLIPSFAIDRTQILLNIFKELRKKSKLGNIPVFLDGPMAIEVTKAYENNRKSLNEELQEQHDPFNFPGLTKVHDAKESKEIVKRRGPKIIISGSGMISGGRILKHAADYLPEEKSVILFVGYPAEGTPSKDIVKGEKEILIDHFGIVPVGATILQTSSLSAHADQKQLLDWLEHINYGQRKLRKVILVHGDDTARQEFANQIQEKLGIWDIYLPKQDDDPIDLQSNRLKT